MQAHNTSDIPGSNTLESVPLPSSREAELAERALSIRARIASLHEELSAVLAEQNTFLPIGRVPDDILMSIFAQLVETTDPLGKDWAPEVFVTSCVCRRWRAVAIAFPALWKNINIGNIDRAKVFIDRARLTPLCVVAKPASDLDGLGTLLNAHMDRIRRLHIWNMYKEAKKWNNYTKWLKAFTTPAPALRDLRMTFDTPISHQPMDEDPLCIFNDVIPELQSLSLTKIIFPHASPIYHNLVRLELDSMDFTILPFHGLLEILQRTLHLESLTLKNTGPRDWKDSPALCVTLPRLSMLEVIDSQRLLERLLPRLAIPPTTTIRVENDTFRRKVAPLRALIPALSDVRHIHQTFYTPDQPGYTISFTPEGGERPALQLSLRSLEHNFVVRWLPDFAALCDMPALTMCTLEGCLGFNKAAAWLLQLARMANLKTLRVIAVARSKRTTDEDGRVKALVGRVELLNALSGDVDMCPCLERLELDWLWDDEELARAREALAICRPSLVLLRL